MPSGAWAYNSSDHRIYFVQSYQIFIIMNIHLGLFLCEFPKQTDPVTTAICTLNLLFVYDTGSDNVRALELVPAELTPQSQAQPQASAVSCCLPGPGQKSLVS